MAERGLLREALLDRETVIGDLSDSAKKLFAELCQFKCCLLILHFLRSNAATLLTADDIAYHLEKPVATIEQDLAKLVQLNLAQTTQVTGIMFYRFTIIPAQQKLAQEVCSWQDRWETRIRDIVLMLWGNDSSITYVVRSHANDFRAAFQPSDKPTGNWVTVSPRVLNGERNE